jgi:uncharacterized membrane protein
MMKSLMVKILTGVFLVVLSGCGSGDGEKADAQGQDVSHPTLIRGLYAFGHEVRALRPCGQDDDLWVIDPSGTLQEVHGMLAGSLEGAPRVFVIATGWTGPAPTEGFGAEYAGAVTIDEIIYVALEGFRCDFDLTRFVFRASGNEPFWMVEVKPEGMTLSHPGRPAITWPEVALEKVGGTLVFRGQGSDAPGVLKISPGPGYDSMSGAYHGYLAGFEVGGEKFAGVALRGFSPEAVKQADWKRD